MSTSEGTPAVEGIDSGKQGNTQTQGKSTKCQVGTQRGTEKTRLPERQFTNNEGNRVLTHMEMWKERKGRTSTDGKSQSAGDQENDTVIHVETWKERQGSTTDKGQREGTTETERHVIMWEGRHTPRDSEQEANTGQQLSSSDRMRRERTTQIEDDQCSQEDTESTGEHV